MQDMHGGGGGGDGRFSGGGDRRLRPQNHLNHLANVKCPRCDSLNTKFCYYNNYNLSQPRHFCKGCRRYWTKGGVLRNVPVGGGCRKTKRSKGKTGGAGEDELTESKSNGQSLSSESSSLTAAVEEGSAPSNTTPKSAVAYSFPDSTAFDFDFHQPLANHSFSNEIGSFTNFTSSSEEMMAFGVGDIPTTNSEMTAVEYKPGPGIGGIAAAEESKVHDGVGNEGLTAAALDWGSGGGGGGGGGGDQELYDLTAGVDPAYWTQSQWTGKDDQYLNYIP